MTSGTTLSKESLYAPLTTYIPKGSARQTAQEDDNASSNKGRKSPTPDGGGAVKFLNIPRELREPALLDHLSTISATYHHPTMSASLMSGAASATGDCLKASCTSKAKAMGMGRNNGGQALPRRSYEDRLLQRSLVLVGGGLMTSVVGTDGMEAADTSGETGVGGAEGVDQPLSRHVVDVSRAQRRRRRKDRGHRVRGSISNSERRRRGLEREYTNAQAKDGGEVNRKRTRGTTTYAHDTLLQLNDMWNAYISRLLGLEQNDGDAATTSSKKSIRKRSAAELSTLLSTAEIIGAYVTIDRCDASKSYVGKEGIVVDSTANTWRVAIPKPVMGKMKKKQKGESDGKESRDVVEKKSNGERKDVKSLGIVWREVVVPRRRSRLSFSVDSDIETSNETKFRFVIGENS